MTCKPLILFDMDGTLITHQKTPPDQIPTTDGILSISPKQQMKKIASSYGIPIEEIGNLDRMAHIWNKTRAYAENHGFGEDQIENLMKAINEPFLQEESTDHEKSELMPNTLEVLEALQKDGFKLGLVTTASRGAYERISNSSEYGRFGRYFEYTITRDDCDFIKPNPEPILRILKLFGKTRFVYVGDTDHDSQAAKAVKGIFVLLNSRGYSEKVIEEMCPNTVIRSLKGLLKIIKDF